MLLSSVLPMRGPAMAITGVGWVDRAGQCGVYGLLDAAAFGRVSPDFAHHALGHSSVRASSLTVAAGPDRARCYLLPPLAASRGERSECQDCKN